MALPKLNKLNIVDAAIVMVVVLVVAIGGLFYLQKPKAIDSSLAVTVHVGDPVISAAIFDQALVDKAVYLNGVNYSLQVVSVQKTTDAFGKWNGLDVKLHGPGYIDPRGYYIFNGQRILINQKAEIHGNYFAPGAITKIENAN